MDGHARKATAQAPIDEAADTADTRGALRAAHEALLEGYVLQLSRELAEVTRAGRSLSDCVAVLVRTDDQPDIAAIVSRSDAIEVAQVAGLDGYLVQPPAAAQLHVFTFALRTGSIRVVSVRPMGYGGDA